MKKIVITISILMFGFVFCQNKEQLNINSKVCEKIQANKIISYEEIVNNLKEEIALYYKNNPNIYSEKDYYNWIYSFTQFCNYYRKISIDNFNTKYNTDMKDVGVNPQTKLENKKCVKLFNNFHSYYKDMNGVNVEITIIKGVYKEKFPDGTFSILKLNKIKDCDFNLSFIKSNNNYKNTLNKYFDVSKIIYRIIDENEDYYLVSASNFENTNFTTYKFFKRPLKN